MKKIIVFAMSALMLFCSVSCGSNNSFSIDSHIWTMTTIQSVQDNGAVVAYGPDSSTSDNASKINMVCNAEKGTFTITDKTNNQSYSGKYTEKSASSDSTVYDISIGDTSGMAVVSFTKYNDASQVNTLILSFEDYSLTFFEKDR